MKMLNFIILAFLPLSLVGGVYSIEEIQGYTDDSPLKDSVVTTYGVVTGVFPKGFFMEMKPGGAWRGIYVYTSSSPSVEVGDSVEVTGTVQEYYGMTEIGNYPTIKVLSQTTPPDPITVTTNEAPQEQYESVLLRVAKAVCTNPDLGYGEWQVDDGSGPLTIDDLGIAFTPTLGDTYTIYGVLYYSYGAFKLEPRDDKDIIEPGEIEGLYGEFDPIKVFAGETFDLKMKVISLIDTVKYLTIVLSPSDWSHNLDDVDLPENDSAVIFTDSTGADTIKVFDCSVFDTVMITIHNVTLPEPGDMEIEVLGSSNGVLYSVAGEHTLEALEIPSNLYTCAEVQEPGEDGYSSAMYLQSVTVVGYAVTGNLSSTGTGFYLNDSTGGVDIFTYDGVLVKPNYRYLVRGTVEEYKGLTEVKADNASDIVLMSKWNDPFPPETLSLSQGLSESWEGRLVCVYKGKIVTPLSPIAAGGGYNMTMANGQAYVTVRIEEGTGINIDSIRNIMNVGDIFTITGVVGQYDPYEPYTTGYQILPRWDSDIVKEEPQETTEVLTCTIEPNPFSYDEGEVAHILITAPRDASIAARIFDIQGRHVKDLCINYPGGPYETYWNGDNEAYEKVGIGVYLLRVKVTTSDGKVESLTKPIVVGTKLGR